MFLDMPNMLMIGVNGHFPIVETEAVIFIMIQYGIMIYGIYFL